MSVRFTFCIFFDMMLALDNKGVFIMFIADLHIHSKYARATSKECVPEFLDMWARKKGLDLIGTGDLTHPVWRDELREKLEPAQEGLYKLKKELKLDCPVENSETRFILTGEISSIYKKNGRVRKIHNVVILPSIEAADSLAARLESIGANIRSDGRPILGLDSRDLLEMGLETDEKAIFIPAHIWTPHFSLFGAYSGFDAIEECFEDLTPYIHALETGLSSDPSMNWRISALDKYLLVSNSDAHSPANLAREANIFNTGLSYPEIYEALENKYSDKFYGTLEFFPEEGKYHYDGHRNCKVCMKPYETINADGICPVCGGKITVGVLHRVEDLTDRPEGYKPEGAKPFESLVPLTEVIGSSLGMSSNSVKVKRQYESMLLNLGSELSILRTVPIDEIKEKAGTLIAEGIQNLREGKVEANPGYDGEYGKVCVISQQDRDRIAGQLKLFPDEIMPVEKNKRTPERKPVKEKKKASDKKSSELNEAQKAAAEASERAVAVIAGPGTGKTFTLVNRIAYLVDEADVSPADITAVTFTNKAAKEMRERLESHFKNKRKVKAMNIGTFHSLCLRQLENINIVDEAEALDLASETVKELNLDLSPQRLLSGISMIKNGAGADTVTQEAIQNYQKRLEENGFIDFDDILLNALDMEKDCPYLLIDEFQDINDLQYRLIKNWSRNSKSIFIIGDPDQSIYGFRGSDDKCFNRFIEDFGPVRQIRLTENYRSTPEIINCSLAAIKNPEAALEAKRENGVDVRLITSDSSFTEGIFIAKEINSMVGGINMLDTDGSSKKKKNTAARGFSDIAVLYRTNRQAAVIEECLQKEGIPYRVSGREDFLKDEEVRKAVRHFRQAADTKKPSQVLLEYLSQNNLTGNEVLQKLYNMSIMYDSMQEFMQALLLGQEADVIRSGSTVYTPDAVTLMTLHGSKGLEYPVVFISGVRENLIPYQGFNQIGDIDEERRLFYVGMTRAQEELLLLTGGDVSRFIYDIPKDMLIKEKALEYRSGKASQLSLFD